ncbi:MAG: ABC transporter permease, partial [Clostridia bacterium]|nr:ABC transporter permease [Clostridia bacterium]
MYIIKNAFRCIVRAKGRNILIGLVVLLLSVSSCIGLSIKQANKTVKKQYADDMEISATLNSKNMRENGNISLDTLKEFAGNELVKNFYYSSSIYFAAGDNIEPLDVSGSFKQNKDFREEHGDIRNGQETTTKAEDTTTTNSYKIVNLANTDVENGQETDSSDFTSSEEKTEEPKMPDGESQEEPQKTPDENTNNVEKTMPPESNGEVGNRGGDTFITNKFFFNMASMNDFTVVGYSDENAIPEYISLLGVLKTDSEELNCIISKNLADENSLETGNSFTLKNPNNEDEVYEFTVVGICDTSKSGDTQDTSSNASFTDNYIYISDTALKNILSASANSNTDEENVLTATYSGTFIFANLEDYNAFGETLDENYTLVSADVSNYEQSISQLETLGKYATYFLIVIFIIGAFVLIIINLFSIRNRKYEIGVLTAIGMKKYKVALQFVIELFAVTFACLIVGSTIGAVVSVPVTNSLLVTINS